MAKKSLTNSSKDELEALLKDKVDAFRLFRFNTIGGKNKNVREGKMIRKDIARIKTALTSVVTA